MTTITILDIFPGHFDQNGDSGNLLALRRRLEWSGFDVSAVRINPGDTWPSVVPDFILIGGGSVPAQRDALPYLVDVRGRLRDWIAAGTVYLAVASGFVLSATEVQLPGDAGARAGLGLFTGRGAALDALHSGPIVFRSPRHGVLHGFVNLAQRVRLDNPAQALGTIEVGPWTHSIGEGEGAEVGTAFGTHGHGPIIAKNPAFADALIRAGLQRRGVEEQYRHDARHEHVDALARRARASLAGRLDQAAPDVRPD